MGRIAGLVLLLALVAAFQLQAQARNFTAGENGRILVGVPGKAKAGAKTGTKISGKAPTGQNHRGEGFWSVQGSDFVDSKGRKVWFGGLMWSGFESGNAAPGGLWARSYQSQLDQMVQLGFNAIRLPFAGDILNPGVMPNGINYAANPDLQGLTSIQVMDKIIDGCKKRGIKIILDYHQHHNGMVDQTKDGLWFDDTTPVTTWISRWQQLAKRYKGNTAIIGADLLNEPHHNTIAPDPAPYWVSEGPKVNKWLNYRSAFIRCANAIQDIHPDWLIFVEGMHNDYWWGGNLQVVFQAAPVKLKIPNKLAYSAHDYGPYIFMQKFFEKSSTPNFPNNLPGLYSKHWGFVKEKKLGALFVGEFGSKLPPPINDFNNVERTVFFALRNYIRKLELSWTYAFWGPDSADTGGILDDDWKSVRWDKIGALKTIMHPNFQLSSGAA